MAYETGTPSDIGDLIDKLFTFATGLSTTPWTSDELDIVTKRQGTLHRGDCYVTFKWDGIVEEKLALYQSLGWTTATDAHNMPDDSGVGDTSVGTVDTGRWVDFFGSGPYVAYHFFAGEGDEPYIYVVVEHSSGIFTHFGFGNIKKFGTWTGGEFVYGHYLPAFQYDDPDGGSIQFLLDGLSSDNTRCATLHMEGLPWQGGAEKWGGFLNRARPGGTDRAGENLSCLIGTSRCQYAAYVTTVPYSEGAALKIIAPILVWDLHQAATPDEYTLLGQMVDVGIINMSSFTPGQEITVGTDTYQVFPWVRKRYQEDDQLESRNAGVAYKKVT